MSRFVAIAVVAVSSLIVAGSAAAEPEAGKYYRIVNVHSKKCLALGDRGVKADESQVVQRSPGQAERQQWSFEPLASGKNYRIINRANGQQLSVSSTDANAPVFASTSAKGRQWSLEKKGENYVFRSRHSDMVINVVDESVDREAPIIQANANDHASQLFRIEEVPN